MKKILLPLFMCVISLTLVFSGCGFTPLKDSPTDKATTIVYGSALSYDNYIYYANAFADSGSLVAGDNKKGKVKETAINRIALENGEVDYDDETSLPEDIERAVSKIAGFKSAYMFSVGDYIYFSSPSTHKDDQKQTTFSYNSYFRVKTDGSNYKEFYTSANAITQQSAITIDGTTYLLVLDGSKLKKFTLGSEISETTLASKVTSAVFPDRAVSNADKFAYYTTDATDEDKENSKTGSYLHKVDITNGSKTDLNTTPSTMSLQEVYNGVLYLTYTDTNTYFARVDGLFNNKVTISAPVDSATFSNFEVVTASDNREYYVLVGANATYALTDGTTLPSDSNKIVSSAMTLLFTFEDYVYYSVADTGIYRVSVLDKEPQMISDLTKFKTESVAFDGNYIYFFAQLAKQSSSTYYMHRADVSVGEGNHDPKVELLADVLEEDEPNNNDDDNNDE